MKQPTDPIALFHSWQREAMGLPGPATSLLQRLDSWRTVGFRRLIARLLKEALPFADAAALATCTRSAEPSVRMVLVKEASCDGFVFYTDYESRKGGELADNAQAALVFYWPTVSRQVRVEGPVQRISRERSQAYWASRPRGSQLSASASQQSAQLGMRSALVERVRALSEEHDRAPIRCPDRWGGYRVVPLRLEFWQGQLNRLHERIVYERLTGVSGRYKSRLIQP